MNHLPESCNFEPKTAAEAFLQQEMSKLYSFEEIQYAWEESGADGDWLAFVENLGIERPQNDAPEIFQGTLETLNALGA
jgi:hypothetical protein